MGTGGPRQHITVLVTASKIQMRSPLCHLPQASWASLHVIVPRPHNLGADTTPLHKGNGFRQPREALHGKTTQVAGLGLEPQLFGLQILRS